ncbi:MAG: hypothetical protein AVO35_07655 [Candidatus Aegiribacteria sp. MLS_C]|nr:MAG: hypothetical protein AVO35_07655 [Candidatus Aegiribacteria sp. MLS_C]
MDMPLLRLTTGVLQDPVDTEGITSKLSGIVSDVLGKPEEYVMTVLSEESVSMSGKAGPAALVEIYSIGGLGPHVNGTLASRVTEFLSGELPLSPDRIYVIFSDVPGEDWARAGRTFR